MIGTFLQMWAKSPQAGFSRGVASVCVALWLAGSVSTLYGSLTPQWMTPHCPQAHSNSAQHGHGSCVWHCDGVDSPSSSGRSWRPSVAQIGFHSWHLGGSSYASNFNGGTTNRGPPRSSFVAMRSAI